MNFDHILLIGHGGPHQTSEVMPFLEAMTVGREISEERLRLIARHYEIVGGKSPYNEQVFCFAARLRRELKSAGMNLPVFVGMKNWHPFLKETLLDIDTKGYENGLGIALTAYRGMASESRYRESLELAKSSLRISDLNYIFLDGWYDQKLFVEAQADGISQVLQTIDFKERYDAPIIFSFHSLPVKPDRTDLNYYLEEVRISSALVAELLGHLKWLIAYQSRPSGSKGVWLEPDICEAIKRLAERGEKQVVVVPLGFLCDHVEILYDLDYQACEVAQESKIKYLRAKTVIHHPKIAQLIRELIEAKLS